MTCLFIVARHLGEGYKRDDVSVLRLMDRVNVFILPTVDKDGFDPSSAGKQGRNSITESPAGSEFHHQVASKVYLLISEVKLYNLSNRKCLQFQSKGELR